MLNTLTGYLNQINIEALIMNALMLSDETEHGLPPIITNKFWIEVINKKTTDDLNLKTRA
jgi:hypothetical protein